MSVRLPDYDVKALNKATDEKSRIGAAWINPDGSIAVVINPFTVIRGGKDLLITLFPREKDKEG